MARPTAELDDKIRDRMLAVNLTALMKLTRVVLLRTPSTVSPSARPITWLLSDDSSNVSGAILPVDGGKAAV